jgi:hypothetical protein
VGRDAAAARAPARGALLTYESEAESHARPAQAPVAGRSYNPPEPDYDAVHDCAFYCIADRRHFVGLVALLNSLRLIGHSEPIIVIDVGLTDYQRDLLNCHVDFLSAPDGQAAVLLKPFGPLTCPAEIAIILDADIIVTRSLAELILKAKDGRFVGFVNNSPNHERFFEQWRSALKLPPLRRQPYLAAGQIIVPMSIGSSLFPLWDSAQRRVSFADTRYGRGRLDDPFYFADMDVLNAILSAHLAVDEIATIEHRLAPVPPFPDLRLRDPRRLVCEYSDGVQPFFLHHILGKPWLNTTRTSIYTTLLTRLLLAPDVAVRLPTRDVPLRLRQGRLAAVDRTRADLQTRILFHTTRQLGRFGIRTRLRNWSQRRQHEAS